jgi:hypothetical protein
MMVSNQTRLSRLWLKRTGLVPVKRTTMSHPPHRRHPCQRGVWDCRCLPCPGWSFPSGATLQNPARLHRGTCRADCFSRPPRAVGVVHERGGDRATGQGGSSQVYRIERAWGRCLFNLHSVSRPFCFSCAWASITVQAE